jgi:outer membrane protein assembly factor BamA
MIFRNSARSMDQLNLLLTASALGFAWSHGTRDNMFYPTRGVRMNVRADFFGPDIDNRFTFQNYVFEINKYVPVREGQLVAVRAMGCGVAGKQIPFYELCQFGIMGNLRGYPTGRYRNRAMFAIQGEWPVILPWRLGATALGGVGEAAPMGSLSTPKTSCPAAALACDSTSQSSGVSTRGWIRPTVKPADRGLWAWWNRSDRE